MGMQAKAKPRMVFGDETGEAEGEYFVRLREKFRLAAGLGIDWHAAEEFTIVIRRPAAGNFAESA